MKEKLLPVNIDAERTVLGCLIYEPSSYHQIANLVAAEDFYRDMHRTIFEAIVGLHTRQQQADIVAVADVLERQGYRDLEGHSIFSRLLQLSMDVLPAWIENAARAVVRTAELRRLIYVAGQIAALAYDEADDAYEQATGLLSAARRHHGGEFVSIGEYFPVYLARLDELQQQQGTIRGIPTGFADLDIVTGGFQDGSLYVPAGRPGLGKTSLCQNFAYAAASRYGKRVAFFSLEMSLADLMDRFTSIHTRIDTQKLRNGRLSEQEYALLVTHTMEDFESLGIYFNYTPAITVAELRSMAHLLVASKQIDLIVVDYLQLLQAKLGGKRITPRAEEIAEIARQLKQLAGELHIPIIAPAQISRETEHRPASKREQDTYSFKMPMLSDLRESGEIEQSADVVMFLARAEEREAYVRLAVAKHRNGPVGDLDVWFYGSETRFVPVTDQQQQEVA